MTGLKKMAKQEELHAEATSLGRTKVCSGNMRSPVSPTVAFVVGMILALAIIADGFQIPHQARHRSGLAYSPTTAVTPLSFSQLQHDNRLQKRSPRFMADAAASTSGGDSDSKKSFWQKVHTNEECFDRIVWRKRASE